MEGGGGGGKGGGGGALSAPKSNPSPFHSIFSREKVTLSYTSDRNMESLWYTSISKIPTMF